MIRFKYIWVNLYASNKINITGLGKPTAKIRTGQTFVFWRCPGNEKRGDNTILLPRFNSNLPAKVPLALDEGFLFPLLVPLILTVGLLIQRHPFIRNRISILSITVFQIMPTLVVVNSMGSIRIPSFCW